MSALHYLFDRDPDLSISIAKEIVEDKRPLSPKPYPKNAAARLATSLVDCTDKWQICVGRLSWEEQLICGIESTRNLRLAKALERNRIRLDKSGPPRDTEGSSDQARQQITRNNVLDQRDISTITDWLVQECAAQRFWNVTIKSRPLHSGLILAASRHDAQFATTNVEHELRRSIEVSQYGTKHHHRFFDSGRVKDGRYVVTSPPLRTSENEEVLALIERAREKTNADRPIVSVSIRFSTHGKSQSPQSSRHGSE